MIAKDLVSLSVPVNELVALPGNPRRGDVDAIARSLAQFGQRKPVVVRRADRVVLAGNHTVQAAKQLGWAEVAAVWVDDDDATAHAFALADNRTAELGGYDETDLAAMVASVAEYDADLLIATGWSAAELAELAAKLTRPDKALTDPDDVPEAPTAKVSVTGDVWTMGVHRLAVGDATNASVRDLLLGESTPDIMFIDPPYGIDYVTHLAMRSRVRLANDGTLEEAGRILLAAMNLSRYIPVHFVCCNWRSLATAMDAMLDAQITPKACIVWDKGSRVQNLDRYAKQHEFILYSGPFGGEPTVATDVWTYPRDFDPNHSTPKPVDLIVRAIETSSKYGDLVLDCFAGSGSTLIACHKSGRVGRLIEIEPANCDVICRRFQAHTGIVPVRNGVPHDFTE